MNSYEDRVLDHALGTYFDPGSEVDLTERILEALKTRSRRTGSNGSVRGDEPWSRETSRPTRARSKRLAAAAALLLLTGLCALGWWRSRTASPPIVATASEALSVQRADGTRERTRTLREGDRVELLGDDPSLLLRSGTRMWSRGRAELSLGAKGDRDRIELLSGTWELETGASPLTLVAGAVALELGAAESIRGELLWYPPTAQDGGPTGLFAFQVARGNPRLILPTGQERLESEDRIQLVLEQVGGQARARHTREVFENQVISAQVRQEWMKGYGPAMETQLDDFLSQRPWGWRALDPWLREHLREGPWQVAAFLLDYIVRTEDPQGLELARELWLDFPEHFTLDHILALAERGAFEMERELVAIWRSTPDAPPDERLTLAAHLAPAGHEEALLALHDYLDSPFLERADPVLMLLSALALERSGDAAPWARVRAFLLERVEASLAGGQRPLARESTLLYEYFDDLRRGTTPLRVSYLQRRVMPFVERESKQLSSLEEVRARADEVFRR